MKILTGLLLLLAAAACGDGPAKGGAGSQSPAEGGGGAAKTLVFARGADSAFLDPAVVTDGESVKVLTNLFDTLVQFKPGSLELAPGLAERWESSADGLVWTFRLREAKFHDGSPVDADAVVFSFLRQKDTTHPAHVGSFAYWPDNFGMVTDVRALDPRTVEIRLDRVFAPFEGTMALFSMAIVSKKAWESEGTDPATGKYRYPFAVKPVGSGPFRFVRWAKGDVIVLERNPDYWGGAPKVGKLIFKTIKDNAQRLLAVETGQADMMDGLNPQDAARVRNSADLALDTQPGLNISYFAMNTREKPFDDVRVRNAFALAIDKASILKTAYDGVGETAVTPIPRGLDGHKEFPDRRRDIARAKELLAEAGVQPGLKIVISCGDAVRDYMPRPKDVAIQIQQDLRAIGVEAQIDVVEWTRYIPDIQSARHQTCLLGWMADYGDADNFLYVLLDKDNARVGTSNNASFYTDETVHGWLTAARGTRDPAERRRLYGLAQDKVFADAPLVPLIQAPQMRVRRKNVRGYLIYPAGGEYLGSVSVE